MLKMTNSIMTKKGDLIDFECAIIVGAREPPFSDGIIIQKSYWVEFESKH